ncbi:hypothetical protein GN156_12830 [bacterium LRH843]|nr:hypothetical protein [bacterium LRH843]
MVWEVGPLIIKQSLLLLILIVIVGLYLANQLAESKSDLIWNGILLFLIIFQFSSLLVYYRVSMKDPLASLALPSGGTEWMIAWICLIVYLYWKTKGKRDGFDEVILSIMVNYLVIETIYYAFFPYMIRSANGLLPANVLQMVINTGLISYLYWQKQKKTNSVLTLYRIIVLYGATLGIVSLILAKPLRMMSIAVPSWFYFIISIAGLIGVTKARREEER